MIDSRNITTEYALQYVPVGQVMDWCCQATSHSTM